MASLIFLRHGQAQNNVERRLMGRMPNVSLTTQGTAQAEYAAGYISNMGVSRIYSSPIQRAAQTADIVGERLSVRPIHDDRLIEIDMGKFTGMRYRDVEAAEGDVFQRFYSQDADFAAMGVETFESVRSRVRDMVEYVLERHPGENVVLVTHMDPIKAMLYDVLGLRPDLLSEVIIANASVNVFREQGGRLYLGGINVMAPSRFDQEW